MFKIGSLYSGSSGNSIFLSYEGGPSGGYGGLRFESSGRATKLLVDAGVSCRRLQTALQSIGEDLADIDGILLTHEHIDHVAGIFVAARRYRIPLHMTAKTLEAIGGCVSGGIPEDLVHVFGAGSAFGIGDLEIRSFSTPHDAADPSGYRIAGGGRSVSVFTDIGEMRPEVLAEVAGSDAVFIESNYDRDMLWNGSYPWPLKRRIDGALGHLSNEACAAASAELLRSGTRQFILSHLSEANNDPDLALRATVECLSGLGAVRGTDYAIQVARRYAPGDPWTV